MAKAISNTSPLLSLYRIEAIGRLSQLFEEVWIPTAVVKELSEGRQRGYDVLDPSGYNWLRVLDPKAMPSEWLSLDLGRESLLRWRWRLRIQSMSCC